MGDTLFLLSTKLSFLIHYYNKLAFQTILERHASTYTSIILLGPFISLFDLLESN